MSTASDSTPVTPDAERAPQRQVHVCGYLPNDMRDFTGPLQIGLAELDSRTGGIVIPVYSGDECFLAVTLDLVQSRAFAWRLKNSLAEVEQTTFDGGEPPAGELSVRMPSRPLRYSQQVFVAPDRAAGCVRIQLDGGPTAEGARFLVSAKVYPTEVASLLFEVERCHDQQGLSFMRKGLAP